MADDGGVPAGRSDDRDRGRPLDYVSVDDRPTRRHRVEVLVDGSRGSEGSWWERRWLAVPAGRRRLVSRVSLATLVVVLAATGVVGVQRWVDERAQRQLVSLRASLGVWTTSTSPTGGQVVYYVAIRNAGSAPLDVTSVQASDGRLRLSARDADPRSLDAGREILVPMSALLTCSPASSSAFREGDGDAGGLRVDLRVQRADGALSLQQMSLDDATLILDVADTLCSVRPELRGYELSGPVVRPASDQGEG